MPTGEARGRNFGYQWPGFNRRVGMERIYETQPTARRYKQDVFLEEILRIHSIREKLSLMSAAEKLRIAEQFGPNLLNEWWLKARTAQLPPKDLGNVWLFMGGRGTGKSRSVVEAVGMAVRAGVGLIHIVAPTAADIRDVIIEGPAGLMASLNPPWRPVWESSKRQLSWVNGTKALTFSGEDPESLRGPQCELCIIDELAAMPQQRAVFDMAMMGLRLGAHPRMLIATTPKPTKLIKALLAMKKVSVTTGSTYDNAEHLSDVFLDTVRELYEGTRLGQQELLGLLLSDLEDDQILFRQEWFRHEVPPAVNSPEWDDAIERVVVGVDPSGGANQIGIVVAAKTQDGNYIVLADRTLKGTPAKWGAAVVKAYDDFAADEVAVELNFGGEMAISTITTAADAMMRNGEREDNYIKVKPVHASRGKLVRAEPISQIYERGAVIHARGMDALEVEMTGFSRDTQTSDGESPNRLDAMVWAMTRLAGIKTMISLSKSPEAHEARTN